MRHCVILLKEIGAVAQLGERQAGSLNVRGSSPLSSIFLPDFARYHGSGCAVRCEDGTNSAALVNFITSTSFFCEEDVISCDCRVSFVNRKNFRFSRILINDNGNRYKFKLHLACR